MEARSDKMVVEQMKPLTGANIFTKVFASPLLKHWLQPETWFVQPLLVTWEYYETHTVHAIMQATIPYIIAVHLMHAAISSRFTNYPNAECVRATKQMNKSKCNDYSHLFFFLWNKWHSNTCMQEYYAHLDLTGIARSSLPWEDSELLLMPVDEACIHAQHELTFQAYNLHVSASNVALCCSQNTSNWKIAMLISVA